MIIENRHKLHTFQSNPLNFIVYSYYKLYLKYCAYRLSFEASRAFLKIDQSHLWSLVILITRYCNRTAVEIRRELKCQGKTHAGINNKPPRKGFQGVTNEFQLTKARFMRKKSKFAQTKIQSRPTIKTKDKREKTKCRH